MRSLSFDVTDLAPVNAVQYSLIVLSTLHPAAVGVPGLTPLHTPYWPFSTVDRLDRPYNPPDPRLSMGTQRHCHCGIHRKYS
jgi:hypothetical protein